MSEQSDEMADSTPYPRRELVVQGLAGHVAITAHGCGQHHMADIYEIVRGIPDDGESYGAQIGFQDGPVKIVGHNGIQETDLLEVVADRLRGFVAIPNQDPSIGSISTKLALQHVEAALAALYGRTADRLNRNVEGTDQP